MSEETGKRPAAAEDAPPRGGPYPPVYFWVAVFLMIGLRLLSPWRTVVPWPYNLIGLVPIILGFTFNIRLSNLYRRVGTTIKPFQTSYECLTDGHYRYSRNPMYLWMLIALIGIFILLGSLSPIIVPPLWALLVHFLFIRQEEKDMEAAFGDHYLRYKQRVRRWI